MKIQKNVLLLALCLPLTILSSAPVSAQQIGTIMNGADSTVRNGNDNIGLNGKEEPNISYQIGDVPTGTYRTPGATFRSTQGECDSTCIANMSMAPPRPPERASRTYLEHPGQGQ